MSKVKALEELREIAADMNASEIVDHMKLYPSCVFDGAWLDAWHDEFYCAIDRLESEIAERFIESPVGDDGEALEIGDELECLGKRVLLNSLIWDGKDRFATETVVSSAWYEACNCRHVKSLEDVLRECAEAYASGADVELGSTGAMFSKYADEIRDLLGVDE